ncbi:sodium- and chloride-dependent GABA transporter ine isoform X2 [Hyalella azteca]|uniref:Transporter n=1 Tax=Hyalella azteca TaxID=294128 RepID=A0A8B7P2G3_HYAAZ|nr:sodium- and chloride-dependent GABA transporter ine isoform X2 [Hyalella azteca]
MTSLSRVAAKGEMKLCRHPRDEFTRIPEDDGPDGHQLTVVSDDGVVADGIAFTKITATLDINPIEDDDDDGAEDGVDDGRATWDSKLKFVLACIGSCVGLGNFWRFPYLCYKSGGGAFLIPYFLMLFVCGIPLLLMEMAIGQYTRRGPVGALLSLCPIFIGSAIGVVIICIIFCSYYNIIISWSIYYLTQSFRSALPWATQGLIETPSNCTANSSTQRYFDAVVLQKSDSIDDYGGMVWPLLGCVIVAWVIVYFSIWKSIRSSGLVVLVTATLPYVFILVFLVRAVTLEGAGVGLKYLFQPEWSRLLDVQVWVYAAAQNFNSIGIGFGSMITFSSYNKFSNNLLTDVWIIALVNAGTSLLAGIIVFSTMGNIAYELDCSITDIITQGPGLAFVAYPQALAKMPYPHFFAVLFFLLLIILGIDSQFATVEVIVTSLQDAFPTWIKKKLRRHEILAFLVCLFCFTLGLPNLFEGGIYYFHLVDYYSSAISLMYLAFFEVVAVVWCYGAERLSRNLREMTGKIPSLYFKYCWRYLSPSLILIITVMSWMDHKNLTYGQTLKGEDPSKALPYPTWAIALGWFIASLSIIPIPLCAVIMVYRAPGDTLWQKVKEASKPRVEECKKCGKSSHNPITPCHCHYVVTNCHEKVSPAVVSSVPRTSINPTTYVPPTGLLLAAQSELSSDEKNSSHDQLECELQQPSERQLQSEVPEKLDSPHPKL